MFFRIQKVGLEFVFLKIKTQEVSPGAHCFLGFHLLVNIILKLLNVNILNC